MEARIGRELSKRKEGKRADAVGVSREAEGTAASMVAPLSAHEGLRLPTRSGQGPRDGGQGLYTGRVSLALSCSACSPCSTELC